MTEQLPMFSVGPTLEEARNGLQEALSQGDGALCPCCGQHAKVYKRKLNTEMAVWLIWLAKQFTIQPDWVDVKETRLRGGDYGKLVHWGLAVQCTNENPKKRTSGLWKPTELGLQFARGAISVPSHVYLYNNEVKGFSDTSTTIREALGNRFNYSELMGLTDLSRLTDRDDMTT
jgi:hypothetical protein